MNSVLSSQAFRHWWRIAVVVGEQQKARADKTEATAVGASYLLSRVSTRDWTDIGCSKIPFKTSVKYLGIKIAQPLSMIIQDQISSVCRDTFFFSAEFRRLASVWLYTFFQKAFLKDCNCRRFDHFLPWILQNSCLPAEQTGWLKKVQNRERQRERERNRERERQTDRQRQRETERDRETEAEKQRETETERRRQRYRDRDRERQRQRDRERQTDR